MQSIKIVFVGDGSLVGDEAVGKSSLLVSYATKSFPKESKGGVVDPQDITITVDEKQVELNLHDTFEGEYDPRALRVLAYPQTDIFFLCFSIASPASFENIETKWYPEVQHHCPQSKKFLVGLKGDLRDNTEMQQKLKEKNLDFVSRESMESLANKLGLDGCYECSALTQTGLKQLFDDAIRVVLNVNDKKKSENEKKPSENEKCIVQ